MLSQPFLRVPLYLRKVAPFAHPEKVKAWAGNLPIWGAAVLGGLLFIGEPAPIVRRDILVNIPIVGERWKRLLEEANRVD